MIDLEAASVKIVDISCISIARLLDLQVFLDSGIALSPGEHIPNGRFDAKSRHNSARGLVRPATTGPEARSDEAGKLLKQLQLLFLEGMTTKAQRRADDNQDHA